MKKTYTNLRWNKVIKEIALLSVVFILAESFIVFAGIFLLDGIKEPITEENSRQTSFYADSVELKRKFQFGGGRQHSVNIYKDSVRYSYNREWFRGRFAADELRDKLTDKKLYITYKFLEQDGGKNSYQIVGITSDDTVFYTVDEYNAKRKENFIGGIVIFSILELSALIWVFFATREFIRSENGVFLLKKIRQRKIKKIKLSKTR